MTSGVQKLKVLPLRTVMDRTSLSRRWLFVLVEEGKFPQPMKLGARRNGWLEHEVEAWIAARAASRVTPAAKKPVKKPRKKTATAEEATIPQ